MNMTLDGIYTEAYKIIREIVKNIAMNDPDHEDLIQDIAIVILEKPPDEIKRMYDDKTLRYYIARIIKNNIYSKNSPFYYKYKKHHSNEIIMEDLQNLQM